MFSPCRKGKERRYPMIKDLRNTVVTKDNLIEIGETIAIKA